MADPLVPDDFEVPDTLVGSGFRLEPLGPQHNERDHAAWMSSIDHIHATPGWEASKWPYPMTLDENLADMQRHAGDFAERKGFTYSVLDGDDVIGCLYIYPNQDGNGDALVESWVIEARAEMDAVVWREVSAWLQDAWPFENPVYAPRP